MHYATFEPVADLSSCVKCYWTLDAPKENRAEKQRIVPDGCMEMIFHYGDLFKQYLEDGSYIIQPKCFVFGQITHPLEIEPVGETGIFAVRFHPDGFTPFSTMPISSLENSAISLLALFGAAGLELERKIVEAATTAERIKIIEAFLLDRLTAPEAIDSVIKSCVEMVLQLDGQLSVNALAQGLQRNRRQLERKFSAMVGLSPKQLSKMIRIQSTLKMLATNKYENLAAIAYEGNYYDQAHFIKDFKEFTGVSPKAFYANSLRMSVLFIDSE